MAQYTNFTTAEDGFAGTLVEPKYKGRRAVIVISSAREAIPGEWIAEALADHGISALALSFPEESRRGEWEEPVAVESVGTALSRLHRLRYRHFALYGVGTGAALALLAAWTLPQVDRLVLVSPMLLPVEGRLNDRRGSGHSMASWQGAEVPFLPVEYGHFRPRHLYRRGERRVSGSVLAFEEALRSRVSTREADLHPENLAAEVLLIAGTGDELCPAEQVVREAAKRMKSCGKENYRAIIYEDASHLLGVWPVRGLHPRFYRRLRRLGRRFGSLNRHRQTCLEAQEGSEKIIIAFLRRRGS